MTTRQSVLTILILVTSFSFASQAKNVSQSSEGIKIQVSVDTLKCELVSQPAHTGVIYIHKAFLTTKEPLGTTFKHTKFEGYVMGGYDCTKINDLFASAIKSGTIEVSKKITNGKLEYQDIIGGPIKAVETSETVKLTFEDGNFVESTIRNKVNY